LAEDLDDVTEAVGTPDAQSAPREGKPRELYLDAFRGLMALVMVQGHVCDTLLSPEVRSAVWYQYQVIFHGSTAPGFLFASGFVAGLPRSPLSVKASVRRARRLLFVLGVGYLLHLPYASFWKTLSAGPEEKAALFACNALQAIAVTQLLVLGLQWLAGVRWTSFAGVLMLGILALGPPIWSSGISRRLPPALGAFLDNSTGSPFPLFPYASFVLAGTLAGTLLGRQEAKTRRRRAVLLGLLLCGGGVLLVPVFEGRVDFWTVSPTYVLIRLGGLLLLLRVVEAAARRDLPGLGWLALIGHQTLLVYVLHLYLLYGGILGPAPLGAWAGRLGVFAAAAVLVLMLPVLLGAAFVWDSVKSKAPHEASLAVSFVTIAFLFEFFTRPW
jgi:hypothetical protein